MTTIRSTLASDTPRTDEELEGWGHTESSFLSGGEQAVYVRASFARQLECELTAAKTQLAEAINDREQFQTATDELRKRVEAAERRLATEQSQKQYLRDRLATVEAERAPTPVEKQPIYDEAVIKAREHLESTAAQELRGTMADHPVSDSPTFPANTTRIVLCDSDASHAFKVNRKAIPPGYAMVPVEQLGIIEHLVSIPEHKRNDNEFLRGTIACIAGCHRTMLAAGGKKA